MGELEQTTEVDESPRWWSKETVAVVTGGNRGIGFEIVRQLATKGVTAVLTARDEARGMQAVNSLKEMGLDAIFHKLDVAHPQSIAEFATWIKAEFGGLDILINNAGVLGSSNSDRVVAAKEVLDANYYGVKNVTNDLLPLFRNSSAHSRVIIVSSMAGQLCSVGNVNWREQLGNAEELSEEVIESFIQEYLKDLAEGKDTVLKMPTPRILEMYGNYVASKVSVNALTRVFARDAAYNKVFVNCMCPGETDTEMSKHRGHSVAEGADTAVWLALLSPTECVTGKFFIKRKDRGFLHIEEMYAITVSDQEQEYVILHFMSAPTSL